MKFIKTNDSHSHMKYLVIILMFIVLSCSHKVVEVITIKAEKDLIPEGIAVTKHDIYISSIHKNKIVKYSTKHSTLTNFIESDNFNFKSGVGLAIKNDTLYALTNDLFSYPNVSSLFLFDVKTSLLLKKYQFKDVESHFFNDLTIDNQRQIYVTDSKQHKIYKFSLLSEKFDEFFIDKSMSYPNGITISDDSKTLFLASALSGLLILNISDKNLVYESSTETRGIDGMKYHKNAIYAIQNSGNNSSKHGLIKINLSDNNLKINSVQTILMGHPLMNIPTTLDIYKNYIYFIANSQMDNFDQKQNAIINRDGLKSTYILKLKLTKS